MGKDGKRIYYSEIELDIEGGLTPENPLLDGNGKPRPMQVMLRWSDDKGAKRWSSTFIINAGKPGEFNARARKTMLGSARWRTWEWSGTDPIPTRIADCYLEATPSTAVKAA
jgi:hypothetical protein